MSWNRPSAPGQGPCPRCAHTTNYYKNKLYVFGGWNGSRMINDLYILNVGTLRWSKAAYSGEVPTPRAGHSAVVIGTNLVVFGGGDGTNYLNDLYFLDLETMVWKQGYTSGTTPCARSRHTATVISEHQMVVIGGGDDSRVYNDVYILDVSNMSWTKPQVTGKAAPSPRWGHSAATIGKSDEKVIIFGGHDGSAMLNDLWLFDSAAASWAKISSVKDVPTPRAGHTMTTLGSYIVVFGGGDGNDVLSDLYILEPPQSLLPDIKETESTSSHSSEGPQTVETSTLDSKSDKAQLEPQNGQILSGGFRWIKTHQLPTSPSGRCAHTTTAVPLSQESENELAGIIVFGGGSGNRRYKDVYFLDISKVYRETKLKLNNLGANGSQSTTTSGSTGNTGIKKPPPSQQQQQQQQRKIFSSGSGLQQSSSSSGYNAPTQGRALNAQLQSAIASTASQFSSSIEKQYDNEEVSSVTPQKTKISVTSSSNTQSANTNEPGNVSGMTVKGAEESQVADFLRSIGMEAYIGIFEKEEITPDVFPLLSERHLEVIGITALGPRLKILGAIRKKYGHHSLSKPSLTSQPSCSTTGFNTTAASVEALNMAAERIERAVLTLNETIKLLVPNNQVSEDGYDSGCYGTADDESTVTSSLGNSSNGTQKKKKKKKKSQQQKLSQEQQSLLSTPPLLTSSSSSSSLSTSTSTSNQQSKQNDEISSKAGSSNDDQSDDRTFSTNRLVLLQPMPNPLLPYDKENK